MAERLMDMQLFLYCMIGSGILGTLGMILANRIYRRTRKLAGTAFPIREKWINLWNSRDQLLTRMNRCVWYPSLACLFFLGASLISDSRSGTGAGLPLYYVYAGAMVPVVLLLLRQALDISCKDGLLADSVGEYLDWLQDEMQERQLEEIPSRARDEVAEEISRNIQECAVSKGKFGQLLSKEEQRLVTDLIREFISPDRHSTS